MDADSTIRRVWLPRTFLVLGVAACLGFLGWRVARPFDQAPVWLSLSSLAVELIGFACSAVLVWALWPDSRRPRVADRRTEVGDVDVVVRGDLHALHDVRTTLVALRTVRSVRSVVVLDAAGRLHTASVAAEFGVGYVVPEHGELQSMQAVVQTPFVLVLDAGDVPVPDIVERLSSRIDRDDVAVVQGMGVSLVGDAPERGIDVRHQLLFERSGLNPALGGRGCAMWLGSGSLARTEALRDAVATRGEGVAVHLEAGVRLVAAGWRVICDAGAAVVAHRAPATEEAAHAEHAAQERAAMRRLWSAPGALRPWRNRPAARLASAAWAVRTLAPYRVVALVALLSTVLLSSHLPFDVASPVVLLVGLPGVVMVAVGLGMASGWTLRPGERTRRALTAGGRLESGPVLTVASLGLVLVARVVSDRVLHVVPPIDRSRLTVVVLAAVWLLAMSLDVLRTEARRGRVLRAPRASSALSAVLGDLPVTVVDLTTRGAGLHAATALEVGAQASFDAAVPTRSGVTTVSCTAVVRNVRRAMTDWRIGVEFVALEPSMANALAEYCVVQTSRQHLGIPLDADGLTAPGVGAIRWVSDAAEVVRGRGSVPPIAQPSKP